MDKKRLLRNLGGLHSIYDKGSGIGNLSHTFNKTNLGFVTKGQWIGEENCLLNGDLPQIYSAVCETTVKAFEVDKSDFISVIPQEIVQAMCDSMYNKLFKFREKMLLENQKKRNIEGMDNATMSMASTVDHMQRIYPGSTLSY